MTSTSLDLPIDLRKIGILHKEKIQLLLGKIFSKFLDTPTKILSKGGQVFDQATPYRGGPTWTLYSSLKSS